MTSPLDQIRDRLAETRTRKHLDLEVPGLADLDVHVRYARLVGVDRLQKFRKDRKGDVVAGNLDFLAESCVGVFAVVDGKEYGFGPDAATDPDEWPRFDDQVLAMLPDGVPREAVEIARALFAVGYAPDERAAAEADIIGHGTKVLDFCGYSDGTSGN